MVEVEIVVDLVGSIVEIAKIEHYEQWMSHWYKISIYILVVQAQ